MSFVAGTVLRRTVPGMSYHTFIRRTGTAFNASLPCVTIVMGVLDVPFREYLLLVDGEFVTEYMQHMHTWDVLKE